MVLGITPNTKFVYSLSSLTGCDFIFLFFLHNTLLKFSLFSDAHHIRSVSLLQVSASDNPHLP